MGFVFAEFGGNLSGCGKKTPNSGMDTVTKIRATHHTCVVSAPIRHASSSGVQLFWEEEFRAYVFPAQQNEKCQKRVVAFFLTSESRRVWCDLWCGDGR